VWKKKKTNGVGVVEGGGRKEKEYKTKNLRYLGLFWGGGTPPQYWGVGKKKKTGYKKGKKCGLETPLGPGEQSQVGGGKDTKQKKHAGHKKNPRGETTKKPQRKNWWGITETNQTVEKKGHWGGVGFEVSGAQVDGYGGDNGRHNPGSAKNHTVKAVLYQTSCNNHTGQPRVGLGKGGRGPVVGKV